MVVATNIAALNTHRNLKGVSTDTTKASGRLASGIKINSAADDAAGLAISEKMRSQIRGLEQAEKNVEDGINLIKTAEGGMSEISGMLHRQRELIIQGMNDTNTSDDRKNIQKELDQLNMEITAMAERTEFNTIPLLSIPQTNTIPIKVTPPADVIFVIDISGSMQGSLDFVKETVGNFANKLASGSRVAFVLYSDEKSVEPPEQPIISDFTSETNEIDNFLNSISLYGGGDSDESGLEAIIAAIGMFDSSGSERHIVFMTDALSHTKDTGFSDLSVSEVNQALIDNNVIFNGVVPLDLADIKKQIEEIGNGTNGETIDLGDLLEAKKENSSPLWIQSGANENQGVWIDRYDCRAEALGITSIVTEPYEAAERSLVSLDNALDMLNANRAIAGAQQNRLEYASKSVAVSAVNLQDAESRIRDADMAKEMMRLTRANVLNQAGIAMLTQNVQAPNRVLSLIQQ
jgi:flagellin